MSLRELNYSQGAQWVQARCTEKTTDSEVSTALQALAHAAARADADCAVEGLFPGSALEVLLSRDLDGKDPSLPPLPVKVELAAMRACLSPLGEYVGFIGMQRPLADYTREEALTLIDVVVTAYQDQMIEEHERMAAKDRAFLEERLARQGQTSPKGVPF